MNALHFRHWNQVDRLMLGKATTFKALANIALAIIARMPNGIEMVSGPISTGGVGNIPGNRMVFEKVIEILIEEQGINIFSQMPLEDRMVELYKVWHEENPTETYCTPILVDFYEPVFSSGKIVALNFIHDWESSLGARWEHDNCDRWKIARKYLGKELSTRALLL